MNKRIKGRENEEKKFEQEIKKIEEYKQKNNSIYKHIII